MKVSEAIDIAETWIDTNGIYNNFGQAIDTLIESGLKQLALEMKIEELEAELNRYLTRSVYNGEA